MAGEWFGRWVARKTREAGIVDPVFVAIPNRNALVTARDFRTAELARHAANAFGDGAAAFYGLRFETYVSKEEKKRQNVAELIPNLRLIAPAQPGTLVLVDDVYTQGFHLEAVCDLLPEERCPTHCFVAGRTVLEPQNDMGAEIVLEREFFRRIL